MAVQAQLRVPFERSYWVVPGRLLAGYYPGDLNRRKQKKKLRALVKAGIDYIIDLTEPEEIDGEGYAVELNRMAGHIERINMPIRDMGIPSKTEMQRILNLIDLALVTGRTVYVHCMGGRGRTGTVVGCFLARHGIITGTSIIRHIAWLRRNTPDAQWQVPETYLQVLMVSQWKPEE